MPNQISTPAPKTFSTVNAVADAATSAETPNIDATAHSARPAASPAVAITAGRRPPRAAECTTSAVAGPGESASIAATGTNVTSACNISGRRLPRGAAHVSCAEPLAEARQGGHAPSLSRRRASAISVLESCVSASTASRSPTARVSMSMRSLCSTSGSSSASEIPVARKR
jgi:hypothetical protein